MRWWLLPLAWMVLIFFLSAQPNFSFLPLIWRAEPISMFAHFAEYAVLAGLLWLAASRTPGLSDWAALLAFAGTAVYAISDEVHQYFVPGRVPDVRDVLTDLAGAAFALGVILLLQRLKSGLGRG